VIRRLLKDYGGTILSIAVAAALLLGGFISGGPK
jgi:hypothetical protein